MMFEGASVFVTVKLSDQRRTVVTSISSAWRRRNIGSTLPALVFLASALR